MQAREGRPRSGDRGPLMDRHVAARARRDSAPLDSAEFRAASEEIASIEVEIAAMEEPPPPATPKSAR